MSTALVAHGAVIATAWPGFWRDGQAFAHADLAGSGAVYAVVEADSVPGYEPLRDAPAPLVGRVHYRAGGLPEASPGRLPAKTVPFGVEEGYVQPLIVGPGFERSIPSRVSFLVHESFHVWQRERGFQTVPEDSITGLVPLRFLRDTLFVSDPGYLSAVTREDALLRSIATTSDPEPLRDLLAGYLEVRAARLRPRADIARVERRYERREGTAHYVGCRAGGSVAGRGWMTACLSEDVAEGGVDDHVDAGDLLGHLTRWRLYASGAVLADALERLGVPGWRDEVAAGASLARVVADP